MLIAFIRHQIPITTAPAAMPQHNTLLTPSLLQPYTRIILYIL